MRARVITGAFIIEDDQNVQFTYKPQCPKCWKVIDQKGSGTATFGSVFTEQGYCPVCREVFDIKITRD